MTRQLVVLGAILLGIAILVTPYQIEQAACDRWVSEQGGTRLHGRDIDCAAVMPDGRVVLKRRGR